MITYSRSPSYLSEDIYLTDRSGDVISSRCAAGTDISNVFSLISAEDKAFVIDHSVMNELIPFILVESKIGPIFIARSFYPAFKLFVVIVPHFERGEIYAIAKRGLPAGVTPAPSAAPYIKGSDFDGILLSERHLIFGKRISDAMIDVRLYRAWTFTNRQLLKIVASKLEAFSAFIGCDVELFFDTLSIDVQGANRFAMESFLLVFLCVALFVRRSLPDTCVQVAFFGHKLGPYFEFLFDPSGLADIESYPELRAIGRYTVGHYFEHVKYYREDGYFIQFCPWESDPSEIGLKEKQYFDYCDGMEEKRCPSLLGRRQQLFRE